jgi:hypothetical protein
MSVPELPCPSLMRSDKRPAWRSYGRLELSLIDSERAPLTEGTIAGEREASQ